MAAFAPLAAPPPPMQLNEHICLRSNSSVAAQGTHFLSITLIESGANRQHMTFITFPFRPVLLILLRSLSVVWNDYQWVKQSSQYVLQLHHRHLSFDWLSHGNFPHCVTRRYPSSANCKLERANLHYIQMRPQAGRTGEATVGDNLMMSLSSPCGSFRLSLPSSLAL